MRRRLVTAETHEMMVDSVLHVPDEAAMQTCKLVKTRNKLVEHIKKSVQCNKSHDKQQLKIIFITDSSEWHLAQMPSMST